MKIVFKTPLFLIFLFLLLYSSFCEAPAVKTTPPLYPGQQTVLALDRAHLWAREHRANSVFTVFVNSYADIQIFSNKEKAGEPLFHIRTLTDSSLGSGSVVAKGYVLSADHVTNNGDQVKKNSIMEASLQRDNPGTFISVKTNTEYTLVGPDGKKFSASLVATDKNDLSLLLVKDKKGFTAPPISISREKALSDKSVVIIGAPLGVKDVIMDGRIAHRTFYTDENGNDYSYVIAPIVSGNSGGPVITLSDMKMVGVIVVVMREGDSFTSISYMVPNTVINKFLEKNLPKK